MRTDIFLFHGVENVRILLRRDISAFPKSGYSKPI